MKRSVSSFLSLLAACGVIVLGISTVGSAAGPNQMCITGADGQAVCGVAAIMAAQQAQIDALTAQQADDARALAHLSEVTSDLQRAVVEINGALSVDPAAPVTDYGNVTSDTPEEYYKCPDGYTMNCSCAHMGAFGCDKMICTCHRLRGPDGFPATWVPW